MTVREFFERFGVSIGVVAVLTALVLLLPGDDGGGATTAAGPGAVAGVTAADGTASGGTSGSGAVGATGTGAVTGGSGSSGGSGGSGAVGGSGVATPSQGAAPSPVPEGADCRPEDGRNPGFSLAMPPCVPVFSGDNGGATARGVTGDSVTVVRYIPQADAATRAALAAAGASDTVEQEEYMYESIRHYMNHHYETYGREVKFVHLDASGPSDNDAAMRSDAIKIAEEIGAFAVMMATAADVLAEELAQRGVPSVKLNSMSREFYKTVPKNMIWSSLPTPEYYFEHVAEYMGKRLAGRNAVHAGDDQAPLQTFREQKRKFGMIWIEGTGTRVSPNAKKAQQHFVNELAKYGVTLAADASYTFDLPRQQQQSTNMISKMRSSGVTTLYFFGDPLYPAFLTREASRQNYYPEWMVSGLLLEDTTFFGRTYDQGQWSNMFGISPLWVFWENKATSAGYREYFHVNPDGQPGDEGVGINTIRGDVQMIFTGIHMAGPNLTAETFGQGMLAFPPSGGVPGAPLLFYTEKEPAFIKDFTEVWWDPNGTGKDEADNEGLGILMKANGGKRYKLGEWPNSDTNVFDPEGAIYTSDNPPGGKSVYDHDADGHTHPPVADGGCRSCG